MNIEKNFVNLIQDLHTVDEIEFGFNIISDFTCNVLGFDGAILLLDNRLSSVVNIHSFYANGFGLSKTEKEIARRLFYFGPLEKSVLANRKIKDIADVNTRRTLFNERAVKYFRSIVLVPLYDKYRSLGVLYLTNKTVRKIDNITLSRISTLLKIYSQNLSLIFATSESKTIIELSSVFNAFKKVEDVIIFLNQKLNVLFPKARNVILITQSLQENGLEKPRHYTKSQILENALNNRQGFTELDYKRIINYFTKNKYYNWSGNNSKIGEEERLLLTFFNISIIRNYFRNALIVPIASGNSIYGIIYVYDTRGKTFYNNHAEFLLPICNQIYTVLTRIERDYKIKDNEEIALRERQALAMYAVHNILTPVDVIYGSIKLLEKTIEERHDNRIYVNEIKQQINRISSISEGFIRYSKPRIIKVKNKVNLYKALKAVKKNNETTINIQLFVKKQFINAQVIWDEMEIIQTIDELVFNAKKNGASRIDISYFIDGDKLIITIKDNGYGIDKNIKKEMFDPFVSTDPNGTGFGLSNIKKSLEEIDGVITAENNDDKGASFYITLKKIIRNGKAESIISR